VEKLWEALYEAGTGGEAPISDPVANSEARIDGADGVLKLTLHPERYEWEFVTVEGESFTDSGSARCH
jgi:acid phosphatase type 7